MGITDSLLHNVEVPLVGEVLVFSSDDDFSVMHVVRQITQEGGKAIRQPTRVDNKWVATISTQDLVNWEPVPDAPNHGA